MWPGGKDGSGVVQRLINEIPPHRVFVSAFLGDCAILRRKRPAELSIGIDLDRANIERWASTPPPFDAALELFCCDAIEWLRHRFGWYRVDSLCAADRHRSDHAPRDPGLKAGSRRPAALNPATAAAAARKGDLAGRVAAAGDGGSGAARSSGQSSLAAAAGDESSGPADRETFVYVDPPYMLRTRSSKKRLYDHEMSDEQHVNLVETLKVAPCLVMVSHYPCPLYDNAFADWRSFTFISQMRGGKKATEKVWCNYPAPTELHDSRYLGRNKRERERIRRRVRNWSQGLARMKAHERQAVLDAITSRHN